MSILIKIVIIEYKIKSAGLMTGQTFQEDRLLLPVYESSDAWHENVIMYAWNKNQWCSQHVLWPYWDN